MELKEFQNQSCFQQFIKLSKYLFRWVYTEKTMKNNSDKTSLAFAHKKKKHSYGEGPLRILAYLIQNNY